MSGLLNWNFDVSDIPHNKAVILALGDKSMTVTKSKWSEKRGAFEGCEPHTVIVSWCFYPEHPYKVMAAASAPVVSGDAA